MYRILPVLTFFILCFVHPLGAQNKQVVSEMQISSNDSVFTFSYIYNNDANPVVETKTLNKGENRQNISQTEWFYQSGLPTAQVERIWQDNKWNDRYRIRYEQIDSRIIETHSTFINAVETNIRKIETIFLNKLKLNQTEFTKQNNDWTKVLETRFFYNSELLTDSTITEHFLNNSPETSYKTSYLYFPDKKLKTVIVQFKNNTDLQYNNLTKTTYTYKEGNIASLRNLNWNSKTQNWNNDTKSEYLYNDVGLLTDEILWEWNSMFWNQVLRYNYQYNSENETVKKLVSIPLFRDWRNTNSVNYVHEPGSNNLTIESVYGFWGGKAGEKLNTHISFAFNDETIIRMAETIQLKYSPFIESAIDNAIKPQFTSVYPNPSKGIFYISNPDIANCNWTLTTLSGTILRISETNIRTAIVDITDLPNGIYLLNISSDSEKRTHKIVKY